MNSLFLKASNQNLSEEALNSIKFFLDSWIYNVVVLIIIILAFLVFFSRIRNFLIKHLKSFAFIILTSGITLYMIGFNWEGCENDTIALFFRSMLSALEMFASHSDLIEVDDDWKNSHIYMLIFSITHFLAVFISAFFIIKLFGYRLYSWGKSLNVLIKLYIKKRFFPKSEIGSQLFVFWGVNNNSVTLAESIKKKFTNKKAIIIFITLPGDSKKKITASRYTFSNFFHFSSDSITNYIDRIEKLDSMLMSADLTINSKLLENISTSKQFYEKLELKNLGRIIKHFSEKDKPICFYFLSDDENENTEAMSTFKKLNTLNDFHHNGEKFHLYCHARRNYFNVKILMGKGLEYKVDLIDTSLLAIRELKKDVNQQPVSFVEKDYSTGKVLTPFNAMIIGFGETGRDALRFLYEFSSFIGKDNNENPRKFYIVDEHIERTKTKFVNSAPALKDSKLIQWCECKSTHNLEFWKKLKDIINELNYIVICVDNDDEAKQLLGQIYEYAYRYRTDLKNFKINVKINDEAYKSQIEDFSRYNHAEELINAFGTINSLFNYNVLYTDVLEDKAKLFYYRYKTVSNKLETNMPIKEYISDFVNKYDQEKTWETRRQFRDPEMYVKEDGNKQLVTNEERKDNEGYIEVNYQEAQDISNAWHIKTKCALAGIYAINDNDEKIRRLKELSSVASKKWEDIIKDINKYKDYELIDNLDGCEHIRWTSKMELLGFVYKARPKMEETSDTTGHDKYMWKKNLKNQTLKERTHHCMIDYNKLKCDNNLNYSIDYDQGVVKLSFDIFSESIMK